MSPPTQPRDLPEGVWQTLLAHAFTLVDEIAHHGISDPFWTFGGGVFPPHQLPAPAGVPSAGRDAHGEGVAHVVAPRVAR